MLENVVQTHLALASGKLVLQKNSLNILVFLFSELNNEEVSESGGILDVQDDDLRSLGLGDEPGKRADHSHLLRFNRFIF